MHDVIKKGVDADEDKSSMYILLQTATEGTGSHTATSKLYAFQNLSNSSKSISPPPSCPTLRIQHHSQDVLKSDVCFKTYWFVVSEVVPMNIHISLTLGARYFL